MLRGVMNFTAPSAWFLAGLLLAPPATRGDTNGPPVALHPRVTGTVEHLAPMDSQFVERRNVDVWLPPAYFSAEAKVRRYPVIYCRDGQNIFDPAVSFIGVDWGIDETMTRLIARKEIPEAIVVAVWNTSKCLSEYMPQTPFERLPEADLPDMFKSARRQPLGDAYLRYLVRELKPAIDARYRTLPGRESTSILGSSMGGLIALYAICEHPEVFGGAACLSTAWPAAGGITARDLQPALPDPKTHRFYFDYGNETKEEGYEALQQQVDSQMKGAGYMAGTNWLTKHFPGEEHPKLAWRKRVDGPLQFLLKSDSSAKP
jgi:predicted alpha/beta superfamily hydrolase